MCYHVLLPNIRLSIKDPNCNALRTHVIPTRTHMIQGQLSKTPKKLTASSNLAHFRIYILTDFGRQFGWLRHTKKTGNPGQGNGNLIETV